MDNVVVDLFMHCFLCKAWLLVIVVVVLFVSVYVPLHTSSTCLVLGLIANFVNIITAAFRAQATRMPYCRCTKLEQQSGDQFLVLRVGRGETWLGAVVYSVC